MERMLTTEEAARRLGVKVPTLYAYVSRGLLESHPDPGRRGSLFDLGEIEALAVRSRGGRQTATRLATITTAVTQLDQRRGPIYRGEAATDLALTSTFEEVAEFLWQSREIGDWSAPDLGPCPLTQTLERMRWALVVCGATDQLRADLRPAAVARAARRATAALTEVVGPRPLGEDPKASIAARLAARLGATTASASASGSAVVPTAAVNAALILLADHELATSTMAVRLAASVRSDPYDAFLAGVATLAGPLHGGASQQAYELLAMAERDGVPRALNDVLRERGLLPGFGHTVYKSGDARFGALVTLAEPLLSEERRAILSEIMELAAAHDVPLANCDLALAALSWGTGMPPDTGRALFAVARVAGWAAHYMEELTERPLRFRARAVYSV
jgi:citrate synthase